MLLRGSVLLFFKVIRQGQAANKSSILTQIGCLRQNGRFISRVIDRVRYLILKRDYDSHRLSHL